MFPAIAGFEYKPVCALHADREGDPPHGGGSTVGIH